MSINKTLEAVTKIVTGAGNVPEAMLCEAQCQVVAIHAAPRLSSVLFPDNMRVIRTGDDVVMGIQRVVTDRALVITTLAAVAHYVEVTIKGEVYDKDYAQALYESLQGCAEVVLRNETLAALRQMDVNLTAETVRVGIPLDDKVTFDGFVADMADKHINLILELCQSMINFNVQLAQLLEKGAEDAMGVEEIRDLNRAVGMHMIQSFKVLCEKFGSEVMRQTMIAHLSPEDFALVDALFESANAAKH